MWRILLLVAAFAAPGLAHAQGRFTDEMGIYSFTPPDGWTQNAFSYDADIPDVIYDAPGGASQGVLVSDFEPAEASLSEAMTENIGSDALVERRSVTIDGMPCEFASTVDDDEDDSHRESGLVCHFYVPFSDGPVAAEFQLALRSSAAGADSQLEIFWQVANSIAWGAAYEPAP